MPECLLEYLFGEHIAACRDLRLAPCGNPDRALVDCLIHIPRTVRRVIATFSLQLRVPCISKPCHTREAPCSLPLNNLLAS
jgi:hypothetical protein